MTTSALTSSVDTTCAQCGGSFDESALVEVSQYPLCASCLQELSRKAGRSGRRRSTPSDHNRQLAKIVEGRAIAGVCGGLADFCNMERDTFRAIAVVGAVVTAVFPFVVIYLILAFVLPIQDPR
jgi:phage shock protein PspC (stress-responsive transcriptional regulator)